MRFFDTHFWTPLLLGNKGGLRKKYLSNLKWWFQIVYIAAFQPSFDG
jgi:hypothetical protein